MRFMKECPLQFSPQEKLSLVKDLQIRRIKPGQRVFPDSQERIDNFYLILAGRIGIYWPDKARLQELRRHPNSDALCPSMTDDQVS